MMKDTIEHGGDRRHIAQEFSPVFDGTVRSEQRAGPLVAAHDDLQQIFGRGQRQFPHAEVIDDQQRHRRHRFHKLPARAVGDRFSQIIQQHVSLTVQHAVALLNGGLSDGLGQMRFAGAAGAEEQCIFALADEGAGSQVEDQAAIHLLIEGEVEVVQSLVRVAEGGLLAAPVEQPLAAPGQLIGDQAPPGGAPLPADGGACAAALGQSSP